MNSERVISERTELLVTIGQVCDILRVSHAGASDPPSARVLRIIAQVRKLERNSLRGRVNQAFVIDLSLWEVPQSRGVERGIPGRP